MKPNIIEVLVGITINGESKFDDFLNDLCKKACPKLKESKIPIKESQLRYCPWVWMFPSRSLNNKINRIHETVLRIICNDKSSSFQDFLDKDNFVRTHNRNTNTET